MIFINHNEVLDGKVAIVEVRGPLNSETSPDFEEYINQLLTKNIIYILLNARDISFVSSEGIGVTLFIQKKISEKNGFFVIFDLGEEIETLYRLLGFDKVFRITKSRIEAMETMDRQIELRDSGLDDNSEAGSHEDNIIKKDISELKEEPEEIIPTPNTVIESKEDVPDTSQNIIHKFDPFIVECVKCKSLIRVKEAGDYLCPDCKSPFSVENDMTVIF